MNTRKRKWILRSIQVLIALVLMLSVVPAGAHRSGGYQHHQYADEWNSDNDNCLIHNSFIDNSQWMAKIPDYRRLSHLSIPETHDTMAKTGLDANWPQFSETQSLDLFTQLDSGIRSLDIRLQRKDGRLECWHGADYFQADFYDVLDAVVNFLEAHPSETILMRIAENSRPMIVEACEGLCPIGDNLSFVKMVDDALSSYKEWIWQPTSVNPTLGEVRGKIMILDNFSNVGRTLDIVASGAKLAEGGNSSLALDDNDNPHISYYSSINGSLNYAVEDSSGWHLIEVDSGSGNNVGKYSSLALDSAGKPHISYYDDTNGRLKYAFWTGDFWWFAPVDGGLGNDVGQYTSIAMDDDDHPHISYYDASSGDLKYAYGKNWIDYGQGWDWEFSQVDDGSGNDVGKYTSLDLDENNRPHISYYNAYSGQLWYASRALDHWDKSLIDGILKMGQYSSLALDEYDNDRPYISYYNASYGELRLAEYVGNSNGDCFLNDNWNCTVIDGGTWTDVGKYSSMALDAAGNPRISYFDADKNVLKYAYRTENGHWSIAAVDSRQPIYLGDVGLYSSLALDSGGNPHVSYFVDMLLRVWVGVVSNSYEHAILMYADLTNKVCDEGITYITDYGLRVGPPCFMEKVYWSFVNPEEIYTKKWPLVKDQLIEADSGPWDRFYLGGLNGTGGDSFPYPWFIVSGHEDSNTDAKHRQTNENCTSGNPPAEYPDFPCNLSGDKMLYEGTNELTLTYMNAHQALLQPRRWGFVVTDFPGEDLIDEIVCSNFPSSNPLFLPTILD